MNVSDPSFPFVSIVMASYNSEAYISQSINSVLNQTFSNWELIIVDDNSKDNTFSIAKSYANLDSRIKVFNLNENKGPSYTRNFAIKNSIGEWISILDSDDYYHPDKLIQQISILNENNKAVLIGTNVRFINSNGKTFGYYKFPSNSSTLKSNLLNLKSFPSHSSLMYKSSCVKEVGLFNTKFKQSEDYDLWLRLLDKGEFICINEYLTYYRIHSNNISKVNYDSGLSQIDFGIAANVCYFLRKNNFFDPSTSDDDNVWQRFLMNIHLILINTGEIKFQNLLNELKIHYNSISGFKFFNNLKIISGILPTYMYYGIKRKVSKKPHQIYIQKFNNKI